jgi:hypothetical protein
VLRLKGRGFSDKSGKRGDQLVTLAIDVPAGDPGLERFVEGWNGGGNRGPHSGFSLFTHEGQLPQSPEARRKRSPG